MRPRVLGPSIIRAEFSLLGIVWALGLSGDAGLVLTASIRRKPTGAGGQTATQAWNACIKQTTPAACIDAPGQ